jgi:hypothetical protein
MIATVYAGLGDKNKAFEYLKKAYQERSSELPLFPFYRPSMKSTKVRGAKLRFSVMTKGSSFSGRASAAKRHPKSPKRRGVTRQTIDD